MAILLAFVMFLTAIPITGSAPDDKTYSLENLMGSYKMSDEAISQTSVSADVLSGIEMVNDWMENTGDSVKMIKRSDAI